MGIKKPGVEPGGLEARSNADAPGSALVRGSADAGALAPAVTAGRLALLVELGAGALGAAAGSGGGDPEEYAGRGDAPTLGPSAGRTLCAVGASPGGRCDGGAPPRGSIGARGVNPGGGADGRACATGCVRLGASTPGLVGMFSSASSVAVGTGLG